MSAAESHQVLWAWAGISGSTHTSMGELREMRVRRSWETGAVKMACSYSGRAPRRWETTSCLCALTISTSHCISCPHHPLLLISNVQNHWVYSSVFRLLVEIVRGVFWCCRQSVIHVLLFVFCSIHHYSLETQYDGKVMIENGKKFISPVELIEYHRTHRDGLLTYPTIPCNRGPTQSYVVFRGISSIDLEQKLIEKARELGIRVCRVSPFVTKIYNFESYIPVMCS